jgi:AraC-like DNA-binding protein
MLHDVRACASSGTGAADAIREALYWIVSRVVARGYGEYGGKPGRRPQTLRDHADAVDAVRVSLVRDLESRASLDDLAASVGVSPFHLSRLFRSHTGQSIHSYRTDARLRASLEPIASGVRIADVAAQLGFASQAHITDRFKRAFGVTPQAWRIGLRSGGEMSRIMEASRGRPPIA